MSAINESGCGQLSNAISKKGFASQIKVERLHWLIKVKVKQSRYRPGMAQRVPGT
jgi:hypothetical protein